MLISKDEQDLFDEVFFELRRLCNYKSFKNIPIENLTEWFSPVPIESRHTRYGSSTKQKTKDPYKYLYQNNPYIQLFHFLHNNKDSIDNFSFPLLQKNLLKLHMGLFAYVDVKKPKAPLRYLYGPCGLEENFGTKPHFFIQPHYHKAGPDGGEFKIEDEVQWQREAETFYFSRMNSNYSELDFVKILQAQKGSLYYERRIPFEHRHEIIYAPSGEMDCCIISWLLLSLGNDQRNLLKASFQHTDNISSVQNISIEKRLSNLVKKLDTSPFQFTITPHIPRSGQRSFKLQGWYEDHAKTFIQWLRHLGFLNISKYFYRRIKDDSKRFLGIDDIQITERGKRLVLWLFIYLDSLLKRKSIKSYTYGNRLYRQISIFMPIGHHSVKWNLFFDEFKKWYNRDNPKDLASIVFEYFSEQLIKNLEKANFNVNNNKHGLKNDIIIELNKILFVYNCGFNEDLTDDDIVKLGEIGLSINSSKWLSNVDESIISSFRENVKKCERWDASNSDYLSALFIAMQIFLSWEEPVENMGDSTDPILERCKLFQQRCRFNIFSHLQLRAGDRGQHEFEQTSRGWIVFPVLYDENEKSTKSESYNLVSVGFFLGTFKDSTHSGEGYYENLGNEDTFIELNKTVSMTKRIINQLSSVENREIYHNDIISKRYNDAAMQQHQKTIHEIRAPLNTLQEIAELLPDLEDIDSTFDFKPIWMTKSHFEKLDLKKIASEFDLITTWTDLILTGKEVPGDLVWADWHTLSNSFSSVRSNLDDKDFGQLSRQNLKSNFIKLGSFNKNHQFSSHIIKDGLEYEIKLPLYTFVRFLKEIVKNFKRHGDLTKKFNFNLGLKPLDTESEYTHYLIIIFGNTKKRAEQSFGEGLNIFKKAFNVYCSKSVEPVFRFEHLELTRYGDYASAYIKIPVQLRRKINHVDK